MNSFPKKNNLEWLRLLFAIQVVFEHVARHMDWSIPSFIYYFPGVPAFFFVSGFLIYASYLNSGKKYFFYNRFLRVFPGLFFVSIGGVIIFYITLGSEKFFENSSLIFIWFIGQISLGQSFNPGFFREIGVGVINGSLWTITVEIIFYLSIPIIVYLERFIKKITVFLFLLSFLIYAYGPDIFSGFVYRDKTFYDFISLTPIPWGWMFITGIFAYKKFNYLFTCSKYFPFLLFPLVAMLLFNGDGSVFFDSKGNRLGLFYFFIYVAFIFYFSFALPYLKLNFDISYGTYIWHMPIINLMLFFNLNKPWIAIFSTVIFALISWIYVEKKLLKMKAKTIKNL